MDQVKVAIDPYAGVIISSCTDKYVTIYEAATGNVICRTTCGEETTAICLSTNMKHLITTSADGIIYIWRLPE
jgi:WD40 repeat protein